MREGRQASNTWYFDPQAYTGGGVSGVPTAGATALSGMTVRSDWPFFNSLIDASKGDRGILTQLSQGTNPVVSWQAPQVGTPTLYRVVVRRLEPNTSNQTRAVVVGSVYTRGTQVTVPADLLAPGASYVLQVSAIQDSTSTPAAPLRLSIPRAFASVLGGIVQMAP